MVKAVWMLLISAGALLSQSGASFEAASIKGRTNAEGAVRFSVLPNRLDVENVSLEFLIEQAWDLPSFEVSGPDGPLAKRYDLQATTGAAVSGAEMRAMLRNLLIERFHLTTHRSEKTESIYRLTVLPAGSKMKAAEHGYAVPNSPMRMGSAMQLNGPMSMRQLAERLTRAAGKPVVDATGLDGYFVINLTFAPEDLTTSAGSGLAAPLLTAAVQDQLGLKLVAAHQPVKILVIDHTDTTAAEN